MNSSVFIAGPEVFQKGIIYKLTGTKVMETIIRSNRKDINQLAPGIYFIEYRFHSGTEKVKLAKR